MFDLNAAIVPGKSAAGVSLGQSATEIISNVEPLSVIELEGCTKLVFQSVSLWILNGVINQISVYEGYNGMFLNQMRIGSTIEEVQDSLGSVEEDDEDNLVVLSYPGLCFETEQWKNGERVEDNTTAKITEIYVYAGAS